MTLKYHLTVRKLPTKVSLTPFLPPHPAGKMNLTPFPERDDDTEIALGTDLIGVALEGYALLKVSGKGEALKGARRELSARFAKGNRAPGPEAAMAE